MNFTKSKIKIFLLNIISYLINKSLSLKKNNYLFLIKLYKYIYEKTKFNIVFKNEIINKDYIELESCQDNKDVNFFTISFSNDILKNITTMKRAKNCLDYWIPLGIKLSNKAKKNFYIKLNCGDGASSSYLSMNSDQTRNLIPDLYSLDAAKKIKPELTSQSFEEFKTIWLRKENTMYWRGSTTGNSYKDINQLNSLKRIEICKKYREKKNMDIKISRIIQNGIKKREIIKYLVNEQIFGKEVSEDKFRSYKYYPDIPGNSLAWGTITKYLAGSLIFKAEYEQKLYYYQLLKPWTHYIPVNTDFSDLEEKLIWAQSNITKSLEIAYSGYIIIFEYLKNIDKHFINTSLIYIENND